MRKFFTIALLIFSLASSGQEVYLDVGKVISTFNYENSSGLDLDLLRGVNNTIGFGFRVPFDFTGDKLYLNSGLSFQKYSANGADNSLGNNYSWDVNYLSIQVGPEFDLMKSRGFQFYLKGVVSGEILLQGTQRINNDNYNLKGKEQFTGTKIFLRGGAGMNYQMGRDITIFTYYLIGRNFFNIGEKNPSDEDLDISTHNISMGILFRLQNFARFR